MQMKICESLQDPSPQPKTYSIIRVKTATDHDHDIEISLGRKRSSFLQDIFRHELKKGYAPGEIKNRIKGAGRIAGYTRLEAVGGAYVKRKDIANVAREFKISVIDIQKLPSTTTFSEDWAMAMHFLREKGDRGGHFHNTAVIHQGTLAGNPEKHWALFARQHSNLLIQVMTTNPCEAWHNRLKSGAGIHDGQTATHSFFGCINNIHDSAHDIENNIRITEIESCIKKVTLPKRYQSLGEFPFAIQKLVATEENKVNT
ncbi:hypothetical protein DFP73DRAFT_600753 [Morchella snyderi]|nr:hypothetical protein DFP73DRAFT_600753 [Morchella snyderi]